MLVNAQSTKDVYHPSVGKRTPPFQFVHSDGEIVVRSQFFIVVGLLPLLIVIPETFYLSKDEVFSCFKSSHKILTTP